MATRKDHEKNISCNSTVINRNKKVNISGGKGNIINIGGNNRNNMKIFEAGSQRMVSESTKTRYGPPSEAASYGTEVEINETDDVQDDGELRPGDILEGEEVSWDAGSSTREEEHDDRDGEGCQGTIQTPSPDEFGSTESKLDLK